MIQQPGSIQEAERWRAVLERDTTTLPTFFYAVATTGIYCRPDCPARRPLVKNVAFFDAAALARDAGYRACKRCQPDNPTPNSALTKMIAAACNRIRLSGEEPKLENLAETFDMSVSQFHRVFKASTGLTPKAFAVASRMDRVRDSLVNGATPKTVTDAMYEAGFSSGSRFYARATLALGMTPSKYQDGGRGVRIAFATGECFLGTVVVAGSKDGVCAILLDDEPERLIHSLRSRFPEAELVGGDGAFEATVACVLAETGGEYLDLDLPLDVLTTAYRERVRQAMARRQLHG